jgi:hypothetical protein
MKVNHKNIFVSTLFLAIFLSCCVIAGFRREVEEKCALLGYYAAGNDDLLPTFQDNLSVSSSTTKTLKTGPIGCPETSARNYHYPLLKMGPMLSRNVGKKLSLLALEDGTRRVVRNVGKKLSLPAFEDGTDRLS